VIGRRARRKSSSFRRSAARLVVAAAMLAVPVFAASASADDTVTFTASQTLPVPPASNYTGTGGGDGWAVALTPAAVFNVFHHSGSYNVACHKQADAQPCWPASANDTSGRAFTVHDADGQTTFSTSGHAGLFLDQSTGKLYGFGTQNATHAGGLVCFDTNLASPTVDPFADSAANPFCGFTPLTGPNEAVSGTSGLSEAVQVGSRLFSFDFVSGTGVGGPNSTGAQNKLLCFDLTTSAACPGQPYSVSLGGGTSSDGTFPAPAVVAIGNQVIVPSRTGGAQVLGCFDGAALANCGGSWPVTLDPALGYPSSYGAAFPLLSSSGEITGLCLPAPGIPCYTLAGATADTPAGITDAIQPTSGWNGASVVVGPRVYVPNGNRNEVECYDYNTASGCANFPRTFRDPFLSLLYTANPDPQRPTCIWVNADSGTQIQNFDAFTGGACGQGPIRVLASSFVVAQPKCTPGSYTSLQITSPARASYTNGSITFADGSGNALPGLPSVALDGTGTASLSGLDLNTSSGLPQFLITLDGAGDTPTSVTVKLTWTGLFDSACAKPTTTIVNPPTTTPAGPPPSSDVGVTVTGPASVRVGKQASFTLVVKNSGKNTSTGIQISAPVPAHSTLVSATLSNGNTCQTGATVRCFVGTLNPGQSAIATITVLATEAGPLTETASIEGDYDTDASNNSSSATTTVLAPDAPPLPPPPPAQPGVFNAVAVGTVTINGVPVAPDQVFELHSGDVVDVTGGSLTFTTSDGDFATFSGVQPTSSRRSASRAHRFAAGDLPAQFKVNQDATAGSVTELQLVGGDFSICKSSRSLSAKNRSQVRSLWGSAKGKFRTRARYSSATVRGTIWQTVDRCDGSLTKVVESVVDVQDFVKKKTVTLTAGQSYLAQPKVVKKPVKQHGKKKTKRPVKKSVHAKQTTYLVRDGDSLSTIATAQLGKERRWVDIAELNGLEPPYTVQPGTRIKLPPR
jgi:uncharacterized repeat protein (TIGR01451 family)